MSLKIRQKSVADTGADEHLVALPPNRSAMRLPRTGPAGCEPETHAGAGATGDYCFAYLVFQRATSTPARCAPPDWTMTESEAGFKFCCRNDSSAKKTFAPPFGRLRAGSARRHSATEPQPKPLTAEDAGKGAGRRLFFRVKIVASCEDFQDDSRSFAPIRG